jgi:hypothetical protein
MARLSLRRRSSAYENLDLGSRNRAQTEADGGERESSQHRQVKAQDEMA